MSAPLAAIIRAHRRTFVALIVSLSVLMWAVVGVGVWLVTDVIAALPDDSSLRGIGSMSRATTVFDAGDAAAFTIFKEQRIEVPLSHISPHVISAIVAVEDQRFFDHGGVDVIRVAGAAWKNVREGWGTQGASTLTQQLARQSLVTREKTVTRKLTEIVVAARLEQEFTKSQILELYLNKVYFGDGSTVSRRPRSATSGSTRPISMWPRRRCWPAWSRRHPPMRPPSASTARRPAETPCSKP